MATHRDISSIARAVEILKCLSDGSSKLTDISKKLSVNKATVDWILKTLENTGFATQDPVTRRYYFGPQIQSSLPTP